MTVQHADYENGVLTVTLAGRLTESTLTDVHNATAAIIQAHGKVRVLVSAEAFTGWERGGTWDDFSFQEKYDPYIGKMAIVGDPRWKDLALLFSNQGLRKFPIEYFQTSDRHRARAWLMSDK